MEFTFESELHYLVHDVEGDKVAHCLDLDMVGVGKNQEEAIGALNVGVINLILFALNTESLGAMPRRAPERYWDMFTEASKSGVTTSSLEIPGTATMSISACHYRYCLAVAA